MSNIFQVIGKKVIVSRLGVRLFNTQWPCSKLKVSRHYWFEFDENQEIIDTDVPEHSDGPEAVALGDDCKHFLFDNSLPEWAQI